MTPSDILARVILFYSRARYHSAINPCRYDHNGFRVAYSINPAPLNLDGTVPRWGFVWVFDADNRHVFAAEAKEPGGKLEIQFCVTGEWRAEFMSGE